MQVWDESIKNRIDYMRPVKRSAPASSPTSPAPRRSHRTNRPNYYSRAGKLNRAAARCADETVKTL